MDAEPTPDRTRPPWLVPAVAVAAVVVVLVVVVLVVREAGPDRLTPAEYEDAVAQAHVGAVSEITGSGLDGDEIEDAVLDLADELDALEPPEQAERGHEKLVAAYREHADVFDDLASLADAAGDAASDPSAGSAARAGLALLGSGRALVAAERDLDAASDELDDAGIDVVTLADPARLLRELA